MTEDVDATADRATGRRAAKSQSQPEPRSFVPLILAALAILSGVVAFVADEDPPSRPTATPAPQVQTPAAPAPRTSP
jgi:hypothetical protein